MDFTENTASKEAGSELDIISAELAYRELARRYYAEYLAYVGGGSWKRTRMSEYIAQEVQDFLTVDTGHAYDILVIETPPQHGVAFSTGTLGPNSMTELFTMQRFHQLNTFKRQRFAHCDLWACIFGEA